MKIEAKKAGIASSRSDQFTSLNEPSIITPTTIKTGAVAALGTTEINGSKKDEKRKQIAVTTDVKPVRPPAPIPAADST